MLSIVRRVSVLCALMAALTASAQRGLVVAGAVFEDRMSLAVRPHFIGAEGVSVRLYRGDRTPVATTKTDRAGMYVFNVDGPGDYVVTVDSRSFHAEAWPEQTFGPAGSLCGHPERGTITTLYEGPCFGGRTTTGSDDASTLATAEHIAQITVRESQTDVDFAFSYDVVVSTADATRGQGTLRQYLTNANAKAGPNHMRFVPVVRAPVQRETNYGLPPRWWTITLTSALPEIRDDDTTIDGSAYSFVSPASAADVHPGRFGEPPTLASGERQVSRLQRPELELVATGAAAGLVCTARCGLRSFALHGTPNGIITRADARLEHVLVGAAPDGTTMLGGAIGLQAERGTVAAHHLLVTTQTRAGITVAKEARLDGDHLDISRCGEPLTGAGIVLFSSGSSIRTSLVTTNPGAGIILGSTDGTSPATGNAIDGSTISGNQAGVVIGPGSSRNTITRNDIMWNRLGGVTVTPHEPAARPRENRISANRFDENGLRPIILDLDTDDPNSLDPGVETCAKALVLPAPRVTSVVVSQEGGLRAVIRGRACPGQTVEIYQSFVTSGLREETALMPRVRDARTNRETLTTEDRELGLPSIGEFNYLGATNTNTAGEFEAMFPLPVATGTNEQSKNADEETTIWATQVLTSASPNDRAFSALAIDATGNTSEMSVRRKADD
jgi:hypothetical protein